MIPLSTDVRLKRGVPPAVMSIIAGTFFLHLIVEACIQFKWVEPDFRSHWMTFDLADPNPFDWLLALFSHESYLHWFGNMLFLWIFGSILEDRLGSLKFFLLFLFCGFTADLMYWALAFSAVQYLGMTMPHLRSLGASGAIMGIMGLAMFRFYRARVTLVFFLVGTSLWTKRSFPIWIFCLYRVLMDLIGSFSQDHVAHAVHIGGFLGGLAAGRFLGLKKQSQEEIHLEKGLSFRESRMFRDAAEELEKAVALNPANALAQQELGFCYWGLHNPVKTADPYLSQARERFARALELYLGEGKEHEAVVLYEKLMKILTPKDLPEKFQLLLKSSQGDMGQAQRILTSDVGERRAILESNFKGQYHRASYAAAQASLRELRELVEPPEMDPGLLEAAGETCLRVKDQSGAEAYFEQLAKKGDERQTVRAMTVLARTWLRTPKQLQLNVLFKNAQERLYKVTAYDEWLQLGEKLKGS